VFVRHLVLFASHVLYKNTTVKKEGLIKKNHTALEKSTDTSTMACYKGDEEKVQLTAAIFQKAMDKADQCLAEKEATIQRLTHQMAMIIREKDLRIADKEEMLQQIRREKEERIAEKNAHLADRKEHLQEKEERIAEKNELLQQVRKEQKARLEEKDLLIQEMQHRFEAEKKLLTTMLERANTEPINLSQTPSVTHVDTR
jgi:predicted phage tail protein